ncbi:MAG: hypothetical protein Q7J38_04645 [Gallionella sp.]|nr:hypothetical protein [Gallionella sp.]
MNIQTIWENGMFRPLVPISIKHSRVMIQVPDEEIVEIEDEGESAIRPVNTEGIPEEVLKMAAEMAAQRDEILSQPYNVGDDMTLTEEQEQRSRAFALRTQLRKEQGHSL